MTSSRYICLLLLSLLVIGVSFVHAVSDEFMENFLSSRRHLQRSCGRSPSIPCTIRASRDIIFLVDASDSMDPNLFYGMMLDYVQDLWCTLNVSDSNRGAIITFGEIVKTQLPLATYSQTEWFSEIERIRTDQTMCCHCCTPTAEAFKAARIMFENNPPPLSGLGAPHQRITFMITDGDPWQNTQTKAGTGKPFLNPKDYWLWPDYDAAHYRYNIVPQEAQKLKNMDDIGARIMLIGVPNKLGEAPEQRYFSGLPDPRLGKGNTQCIQRRRRRDCETIKFPPFPIVSLPVDKNLFDGNQELDDLLDQTSDDLCEILVTNSPTSPTFPPTPPTRSPTVQPGAPTFSPGTTHAPTTLAPTTQAPTTLAPTTQAPTTLAPTTLAPTTLAPTTKSPTNAPNPPTLPPGTTFSPTLAPGITRGPSIGSAEDSFNPTRSPTREPTFVATKSPTLVVTGSPTLPANTPDDFHGMDLYLFVDRSRSMRWRASDCRRAAGSNPNADDNHVCWELFLYFAERLVTRTARLKYDGINEMGWQGDNVNMTRGLRVWTYGFACQDNQKVPLVFKIGEGTNRAQDFEASLVEARQMVPDGGTCPGAAIERAVGQIMARDLLERPYKAALLLTDGVFYDQPKPKKAAKGLHYFGVLTYALGIAIPFNGNNQGLTPSEIKDQREQLLGFVNGDASRVKNFGAEGINILDEIARTFVDQIPYDVAEHFPRIFLKPYWCNGFSSDERCLNLNPESFPTGLYCKWVPNNPKNPTGNGKCQDKCGATTLNSCVKLNGCNWKQGICRPKDL